MVVEQVEMSPEEHAVIESRARALGYATVSEYLLSLAHDDIGQSDEDDGQTKEEILAGIRESMRQALRGEGRPIEELFKELEDDDQG